MWSTVYKHTSSISLKDLCNINNVIGMFYLKKIYFIIVSYDCFSMYNVKWLNNLCMFIVYRYACVGSVFVYEITRKFWSLIFTLEHPLCILNMKLYINWFKNKKQNSASKPIEEAILLWNVNFIKYSPLSTIWFSLDRHKRNSLSHLPGNRGNIPSNIRVYIIRVVSLPVPYWQLQY